MARPKWATSMPVAHQERRLPFSPAVGAQRVLSDQCQQGQLVVAGPAPVGRIDDTSEPREVDPRGSFIDASSAIIRSLPRLVCFGDADKRVADGLFG